LIRKGLPAFAQENVTTRRYSIAATEAGWEVREERDSEVVRKVQLPDWLRVERARAERLGDVVVGAGIETDDAIALRRARG